MADAKDAATGVRGAFRAGEWEAHSYLLRETDCHSSLVVRSLKTATWRRCDRETPCNEDAAGVRDGRWLVNQDTGLCIVVYTTRNIP